MLVLTRKTDERITIGDGVELVVLSIRGNRVRLGIAAPSEMTVVRVAASLLPPTTTVTPQTSDLAGCGT